MQNLKSINKHQAITLKYIYLLLSSFLQIAHAAVHKQSHIKNGIKAFLPLGYLLPNSFLYALCFFNAHNIIWQAAVTVKSQAKHPRWSTFLHDQQKEKRTAPTPTHGTHNDPC
jgi:hypothetical protein